MTCGGSFPSDRLACFPAAATASSTASRGTNAASTPSDTQSVSRPAATTPLSAISRDHAGHQPEHHAATRPGTEDQLRLSGIGSRLGVADVAMPLKRYANCVDGQELAANERIAGALGDGAI